MARATQSLGLLKHRPSIHRADQRDPLDSLSTPETLGLETLGLGTIGLGTLGLETLGLETSGLETTGLETSGLETNSLEPLRAGRQAEEAVSDLLKRPQGRSDIGTREVARDGGECPALTH